MAAGRLRLVGCATIVALALLSRPAGAEVSGEPGSCAPPCRTGFFCQAGKCISLCNPPCPDGQRCVEGDCQPIPRVGKPDRDNFLALLGVFHGGLNNPAQNMGELRVEFAGRYTSFEIGPAFGNQLIALRSAIQGHVPFQPFKGHPFFVIPTIKVGYTFGWIDDGKDTHKQDLFITPGVRLRYDIIPRMALLLDPFQLQITFLRLRSEQGVNVHRTNEIPVSWNLALGLAFLY